MTESNLIIITFICLTLMHGIAIFWLWRIETTINSNADLLQAVKDRVIYLTEFSNILSRQQKTLDDNINGLVFDGALLVTSGDDVKLVNGNHEMQFKIIKD